MLLARTPLFVVGVPHICFVALAASPRPSPSREAGTYPATIGALLLPVLLDSHFFLRLTMRVTFAQFLFDTSRHELLEEGKSVELPLKAFRLLEILIQSAPAAVTKEDLYQQLWGETFVEEANLSNLISVLRAALGDSRKQPRFIKTIHGYGYSFVGETTEDRKGDQPERVDLFVLLWRQTEFVLKGGENIIGRDAGAADVIIPSTGVSRRHASIMIDEEGASIFDLSSKNGTFVGSDRIESSRELEDGDEIRVGTVILTFRHIAESETTRTMQV